MANDKDFKVKNGLVVGAGDITSTTDTDITVTPSGTGQLVLDGLNWPTADGSVNHVLKTDGAGNLSFSSVTAAGSIQTEEYPTVTDGSANVTMTSAYTLAQIEVYLNGVKLRPTTEYTVSGTTLTFSENLSTGDLVTVVALSAADSFTGAFANLNDVDTTGRGTGDLIRFDGTNYSPATLREDANGNVFAPSGYFQANQVSVNERSFYALGTNDGSVGLVPELGGGGYNPLSAAGDAGIIFTTDSNSSSEENNGLVIAAHGANAGGLKILENGNIGVNKQPDANAMLDVNGSIQDAQGNVRALEITTDATSSVTIGVGSSGKYFRFTGTTVTINMNAGNFAAGDIFTLHNATSSDMTIDFAGNFTDTVYIAGDGVDKNNSTITLAGYGLATCIAFTSAGMIINGNVS